MFKAYTQGFLKNFSQFGPVVWPAVPIAGI